ncbi:MAG TPA: glycine--tRNA ligase [Dehalococcoidia bacterium]|nr:glycine--tRNA ligase [Dehalococcoidia bacterium]
MVDTPTELQFETLVSLCKRRGFVFPTSEIYGGIGGFWDYGPLGVEMKNNIKRAWWTAMVQERDDVVGIDASIIMNPRVWEASGHVATFTDPMVDCKNCKHRFRADHIESDVCPDCGAVGQFTEARPFNLMFKTYVGPVEDSANQVYLRPETAQAMFTNFENVVTSMRRKLPFGIAQIGRSFRNEITPGNFIFRDREFEQMEMEYFCKPADYKRWHDHWLETRLAWHKSLGVRSENLRVREHTQEELSHYSNGTYDIEYNYASMGWSELEGIASRTDFDLKQHAKFSGKSLTYFDEEANEHIVPYVIEPAVGVDRTFLVLLYDAYREEEVRDEKRVYLALHPRVAPIKVAILPLSRNEKLAPLSQQVYASLRPHFMTQFDDAQSIGRRYRRQDEIGTPLCITIDFDSLDDNAVTIRERDSMEQTRVRIEELAPVLQEKLAAS